MPEIQVQGGLTLADYIRVLRRNWLVIALAAVLGVGAGGAVSLLTTPKYEASTQLYVSVRTAAEGGALSDLTQGGTYARQAVLSYVDVIMSASVLDEVIADLKLTMTAPELREMVAASSPKDSVILNIDVTGPDRQQVADIANSVGENFTTVVTTVLEKPRTATASPVQISTIEKARVPEDPISPNVPLNLGVGLVLGLVLGAGVAVLRSVLDARLRSLRDVHALTELPVLGAIPDDPKADTRRLVVHENPNAPRSEAFRSLRTNLQFVNVDGAPRSYVITSASPGEGKTTVATNLAISLAQAGSTVLLIDADMRKPMVAGVMGVDGEVGLSNLLVGMVKLEDVVQRWQDGALFVLPAGRIPPNPSELLGSLEMEKLLEAVVTRFDYVIIDSPPVLAVTDAAILSRLAGGTILVAGVGVVRRDAIQGALEAFTGIARRVSGLVVTRVPASGPDAYRHTRYEYSQPSQASQTGKPSRTNRSGTLGKSRQAERGGNAHQTGRVERRSLADWSGPGERRGAGAGRAPAPDSNGAAADPLVWLGDDDLVRMPRRQEQ